MTMASQSSSSQRGRILRLLIETRGVMDTVPADHASGSLVIFFSDAPGLTQPTPYVADLTVQAKILPESNIGIFPLGSASYISLTTRSRFARPYPPGALVISGQSYGVRFTYVLGSSAPTFTWKSRNRLTQAAAKLLVRQDAGDITPEAGTIYKVAILIGGTLVRTVTAIAVETFSYLVPEKREAADPFLAQKQRQRSLRQFKRALVRLGTSGSRCHFELARRLFVEISALRGA